MSEPFLAEIRMVGFNFAPRGWAFCDGQILPINQNQSLYSLLGTTYGGDGRTSFALPELRGRTPIHTGASTGGTNHTLGQGSGQETVTLTVNEIPNHSHAINASNADSDAPVPNNTSLGSFNNGYNSGDNLIALNNGIQNNGGGQAHNNMQPTLAVNFCIALQGLFPPRN